MMNYLSYMQMIKRGNSDARQRPRHIRPVGDEESARGRLGSTVRRIGRVHELKRIRYQLHSGQWSSLVKISCKAALIYLSMQMIIST
jgi:hypothetical protein